ncbi:MAG: glycosyltransferase [Candidatus Cloacimonadaceae bacterium]|jgi:glycosyltransferase involved in cell wall biosynthesis|nr:glycosyltransferase [Candidatus Cloacimonadaceae bacterium]
MKRDNRILMIVNEFPPTGESGVQRPLKFLKYLDRAGWECWIVTPRKPTKNVLDQSLCEDIPPNAHIIRTHNWGLTASATDLVADIRAKTATKKSPAKRLMWKAIKLVNDILFPVDKQIGWTPFALLASIRVIRKQKIRNVYITGFPFSALLMGIPLKRIFGNRIFWVADYRDAWQFEPLFESNVLPFRSHIIRKCDDLVLRTCDRILFVTEYTKARYQKHFAWIKEKAEVITNGFDDDDFAQVQPHKFDKFTFVYMGKIYGHKGNPIPLLRAIANANIMDFQYIHIGTIATEVLQEIESMKLPFFHFWGYKSHTEAINISAGADINVIVNNNDAESTRVFPGKIFELIKIGKPILAVGPPHGIVKDLMEQTQSGAYACIDDETAILDAIHWLRTDYHARTDSATIRAFSRRELTAKLIEVYHNGR